MLSIEDQRKKLETSERIANKASESADIDRRLGALVIYAGCVDLIAIQAARLIEQIILKGQLAERKTPTFKPNEDKYFYDHKISTRTILKGIGLLLPFSSSTDPNQAAHITDLAKHMINLGHKFLDYRNPIMHNIGDPRRKLEDISTLCDEAIARYHSFRDAHTSFFQAAAPFRFSERELRYFYGKS